MKLSRAINILELKILEYQNISKQAKEESESTDNFKNFLNKNSNRIHRERDIISMKKAIEILKQHN